MCACGCHTCGRVRVCVCFNHAGGGGRLHNRWEVRNELAGKAGALCDDDWMRRKKNDGGNEDETEQEMRIMKSLQNGAKKTKEKWFGYIYK